MKCLVCGNKLAIFRKLSLGDFCCQEHRALFLKEHNDQGLARLMETGGTAKPRPSVAGTRVYAQFLHEDLPASAHAHATLGFGPLPPQRALTPPEPRRKLNCQLAPAKAFAYAKPHPGMVTPMYFESAQPSLRMPGRRAPVWHAGETTHLRRAGLILPWSSGAGSQNSLSFAPLAAAAWAQSGYTRPISAYPYPVGALRFRFPGIEGKLELPMRLPEMAPAAVAAFEAAPAQPGRVRLATPVVSNHGPKLELTLPPVTPAEQRPELLAESALKLAEAPAPALPAQPAPEPRLTWFAALFAPKPKPEKMLSARARSLKRTREEVYGYDEPQVPVRNRSAEAWRAMFAGWTPSPAIVSGMFAVLFLFSAIAIFLSAPSALSERSPSWRFSSLRAAIRSRSVLKLEDNFRSGLGSWSGPSGWSLDWSYDPAGFLRPGRLGFLASSMKLVNYRLELMGQIERKSLGWAFRAKDANNYYVAKLTITRPGPLPLVSLVHYPVTGGHEGPRVSIALPFAVRNDTLYNVEMNIRDNQFRASVNGHVVDAWSDDRLRAGGVGFISGKGEAARVSWIRVSDRDDVIGRVCSYLSARNERQDPDPLVLAFFTPPGL